MLIDHFSHVGKDASVLLRDPTGAIAGTLHAEVLAMYKKLERGVVIVLRDVHAMYLGGVTEVDAVHVSIQLCHVGEVHVGHMGCVQVDGVDVYTRLAKHPPGVVRRRVLREVNARVGSGGRGMQGRAVHARPAVSPGAHGGRGGYRGRGLGRGYGRGAYGGRGSYAERGGQAQRGGSQVGQGRQTGDVNVGERRPFRGTVSVGKRVQPMQMNGGGKRRQTEDCLTDDQLDCLLGEVDVDALIAASGKKVSGGDGGREEVGTVGNGERKDVSGSGSGSGSVAAKTNELSCVNHDIIDSLFDGVDACEFD